MSSEDQERQRAARLRQQQLSARDPGPSKIRGYDWDKHARKGQTLKKQQKPFLVELFAVFPGRWRGVMFGLALALVPALIIAGLTQNEWRVLALLPPLIFGIGGYVVGAVTEDKIDR